MERIDCLIFGYRLVSVEEGRVADASSILLKQGIIAKVGDDGRFSVRERDMKRLSLAFDGRIEYTASELRGIPGKIKSFPYKVGGLIGGGVGVLLIILSSLLVWDIRIDGNINIPDSRIEYELSEAGFSVGDLWLGVDRSEIETEMLGKMRELSWININRRGTVAYVTVAENASVGDEVPSAESGYSNIVASCDCVIEELTVSSGIAVVKVGDAVKRGDLLICGVLPEEAGGGFCRAEGSVVGRISDRVEATVDRVYVAEVSRVKRYKSIDLKFFDFSINIFKRYGNPDEKYDIIKEIRSFSLFGGEKLPFEIITETESIPMTESASYGDAQLVRLCSKKLRALTQGRTVGGTLIRIRTYGDYTEEGYAMYSDLVYLSEVGENVPFAAEE